MKVVILCGGRGTRLAEETVVLPKPMIDIGGKPMLWHIMKIYSHYGFNDFILCLGYKGYVIKEYFSHYLLHMSDVTIDFAKKKTIMKSPVSEPWKVTMVDTGIETLTGGRLKRIAHYLDDETFMMTYGDGIGDINIRSLVDFHKKAKSMATVTAVHPLGRFGFLQIGSGGKVQTFMEKPKSGDSWINAGFFVLEPEVLKLIKGDEVSWERGPIEQLAADGKLAAYKHSGFWKPMDTLRDKNELEELWRTKKAPWKAW